MAKEEATIGLDTWTFRYDAALSEGDMPLECGSPATYEGMTVFFQTEREKQGSGGSDCPETDRQCGERAGTL